MREQRYTPTLFILTFASILLVGIVSTVSAKDIYQEYNKDGLSQPAAAVLMQGISHHVYPWDFGRQKASGLPRLAAAASANIPALYLAAFCPDPPKGSHTAMLLTAALPEYIQRQMRPAPGQIPQAPRPPAPPRTRRLPPAAAEPDSPRRIPEQRHPMPKIPIPCRRGLCSTTSRK